MHRLDVKRIQMADACDGAADAPAKAAAGSRCHDPCPDLHRLQHQRAGHGANVSCQGVSPPAGDRPSRPAAGAGQRSRRAAMLRTGRYPDPEVLAGISAAEIMSADLFTVRPETQPLLHAATADAGPRNQLLAGVGRRQIVGILTSTDLGARVGGAATNLPLGSVEQSI